MLSVGDEVVLRADEDTRRCLVLRGVIQQWGITLVVYRDRRKPVTVNSTRFARVMRKQGIQQLYDLSPQPKRRVDRMLDTFRDRLVSELHLAGASTIYEAGLLPKEFPLEANKGSTSVTQGTFWTWAA